MRGDISFERAVELAEHHIAIGQTTIFLFRDEVIPDELYALVEGVDFSGAFRLSGPAGVRFAAPHPCGLTFEWTVDFEKYESNGTGTHQFDRDRLREVIRKLNPVAASNFASFLENKVLPPLRKRTEEIRAALNRQQDSHDCVLGLIAFTKEPAIPDGKE